MNNSQLSGMIRQLPLPRLLQLCFVVNTMDTSDAVGDAADPDDRPSCSTPPATGLQFLCGGHEVYVCDEEALGDGGTEWMRRPRKESGDMEDGNDAWCPSPRPMSDAAESDGVEEWVASPRAEVAAEPAATVATQVVDAATPESTGSVALKKRRFTQQVLQWGTPPQKPVAPPPRPAPPPIRPLSDEKKEKAYLKAQKSYKSDWLPKFDWLIMERTPEGDPCLRCSVCMEHGKDNARYGRNGAGERDLQIGSMRWHENSAKHEDAMNKQANLLQKIAD
ncbi:unnamed protein product [Closterium sp. Yama58-4]|nr:unnamed protein product [Closterium sp. Yama58-4]